MPEISLTDFVDFVIKVGTPKLTKVREIKRRGPYSPASDFWKRLREGVQSYHRTGSTDKSALDRLAANLADPKKRARYPAAVKGYKKFLGRKNLVWFEPPTADWTHQDLTVRVNPELGLELEGAPYVIKMYFKDEAPTANRVAIVVGMMKGVLGPRLADDARMAVLDVSKAKVLAPAATDPNIEILLEGEAAAFLQIWKGLTG